MTSRDIAREVGVSQPTVSRALRGDPRVAPRTQELVREAAERLGYVPHAAARSMITDRAESVAIVASDLNNPFYPALVQALHGELERHRQRPLLLTDSVGRGGGAEIEALVQSGIVDGAIVSTATADEPTAEFLAAGAPVVLVVRDVPGAEVDVVLADNRGGAELAAELLARHGHRRIGLIGGPADTATATERASGFRAGLEAAGIEFDPGLCISGPFSHEAGERACAQLLGADRPPTAIFCGNDVIALGALDAARRLGVEVPAELSVIGFDDMPLASWQSFRLTTIHQPIEAMAAAAVELILSRIAGEAGPPQRRVFPTEVVLRDTVADAVRGD